MTDLIAMEVKLIEQSLGKALPQGKDVLPGYLHQAVKVRRNAFANFEAHKEPHHYLIAAAVHHWWLMLRWYPSKKHAEIRKRLIACVLASTHWLDTKVIAS